VNDDLISNIDPGSIENAHPPKEAWSLDGMLRDAHAAGYRAGLEAAAKCSEGHEYLYDGSFILHGPGIDIAAAIRALEVPK